MAGLPLTITFSLSPFKHSPRSPRVLMCFSCVPYFMPFMPFLLLISFFRIFWLPLFFPIHFLPTRAASSSLFFSLLFHSHPHSNTPFLPTTPVLFLSILPITTFTTRRYSPFNFTYIVHIITHFPALLLPYPLVNPTYNAYSTGI